MRICGGVIWTKRVIAVAAAILLQPGVGARALINNDVAVHIQEYVANAIQYQKENLVQIFTHEEKIELNELTLLGMDKISAYVTAQKKAEDEEGLKKSKIIIALVCPIVWAAFIVYFIYVCTALGVI